MKIFTGLEDSSGAKDAWGLGLKFELLARAFTPYSAVVALESLLGASLRYIHPRAPTDRQDGSYRGHRPLLFQRRGALLAGGGPAGPDGGPRARRRRRGAGAVPQGLHAAHVPSSVPQTALRRFYGPPAP